MRVYVLFSNCDAELDVEPNIASLECRTCQGEERHYWGVFATERAASFEIERLCGEHEHLTPLMFETVAQEVMTRED